MMVDDWLLYYLLKPVESCSMWQEKNGWKLQEALRNMPGTYRGYGLPVLVNNHVVVPYTLHSVRMRLWPIPERVRKSTSRIFQTGESVLKQFETYLEGSIRNNKYKQQPENIRLGGLGGGRTASTHSSFIRGSKLVCYHLVWCDSSIYTSHEKILFGTVWESDQRCHGRLQLHSNIVQHLRHDRWYKAQTLGRCIWNQ